MVAYRKTDGRDDELSSSRAVFIFYFSNEFIHEVNSSVRFNYFSSEMEND